MLVTLKEQDVFKPGMGLVVHQHLPFLLAVQQDHGEKVAPVGRDHSLYPGVGFPVGEDVEVVRTGLPVEARKLIEVREALKYGDP